MAGTTLDDVKAAGVSGSQMYHCFPGKDEFAQSVISCQVGVIVVNQRQANLGRVGAAGLVRHGVRPGREQQGKARP